MNQKDKEDAKKAAIEKRRAAHLEDILTGFYGGEAIYSAGLNHPGFDFKRGQEILMKKDLFGDLTLGAGNWWKEFDYEKGLEFMERHALPHYYESALKSWPEKMKKKVSEEVTGNKRKRKRKRKVPSFFTEEEKDLYRTLSKEQRGHIQYMSESKARGYLFNCIKNSSKITGYSIMEEIRNISEGFFDDKVLSKKLDKSDLADKGFKCKYCGQAFRTDEMRKKHQKICM